MEVDAPLEDCVAQHSHLYLIISLLILALGLAACDPTSLPFTTVLQVASANDQIYAYTVQSKSWGPGCCGYGDILFYSSQDGGNTWLEIAAPPGVMEQKKAAASERLNQACDREFPNQCTRVDGLGRAWISTDGGETWYDTPSYYLYADIKEELVYKSLDYQAACSLTNPPVCFRLTQSGQIERSVDGGVNWSIDWQIPEGRNEYIERSFSLNRPGVPVELRPLDLAVYDTAGGVGVIAAIGNQGILVRTPQGQWESHAVGDASPLSYSAKSLREAFSIVMPEAARSTGIACLFAVVIGIAAYITLRFLFQKSNKASPWMPHFSRFILIYPLILFAVLLLPYLLWAMGTIATLEAATMLSAYLGVLVSVWGLTHTIWSAVDFSKQTIKESDVVTS